MGQKLAIGGVCLLCLYISFIIGVQAGLAKQNAQLKIQYKRVSELENELSIYLKSIEKYFSILQERISEKTILLTDLKAYLILENRLIPGKHSLFLQKNNIFKGAGGE